MYHLFSKIIARTNIRKDKKPTVVSSHHHLLFLPQCLMCAFFVLDVGLRIGRVGQS